MIGGYWADDDFRRQLWLWSWGDLMANIAVDAELLAAMDAAQDHAKAHLDERNDEHKNSRMYVRE